MPQTERQRRWYLGLTPEQREERRRLDRERKRAKYDPERERSRNALRVFAGALYVTRAKSVEEAERIRAFAVALHAEFLAGQRARYENFLADMGERPEGAFIDRDQLGIALDPDLLAYLTEPPPS